ncbi:MAG: sigma-54-dependent transcriptional regulator [Hyphomicrobiales bacterium]
MTTPKVLFIDDEEHIRSAARQALDLAGFEVECFAKAEDVLENIGRAFRGVVVTDIRMPGMDGMTLMQRIFEIDPELPVVLITGHGDVQLAVEAMRAGAYDFIEKPFASSTISDVAGRALDKRNLTLENRELRSAVGRADELEDRLVGRTAVMVELRQQIRAIAGTDADVLIVGDTGTGKEVAARVLHEVSARAGAPFVAINCGAIPADMIESELFGHEAGAFPGATRARFGKFEHARGGTIFLDEIESMPAETQVKLVRVIQERAITRLGSNDLIELDVRFIAASKADLEQAAAEGRFRSDLVYRLNVVTLRMPNLDERQEDIPRLFCTLVQEAAAKYRRPPPEVPSDVLAAVVARSWPGNVRELRNAADRFALGLDLFANASEDVEAQVSFADRIADFERNAIAAELTAHGGNLKSTYESLGVSRKTLYEKMQKYGLNREDYQN